MDKKEFPRGARFRFSDEIEYADGAIVSKTVIKRETGNVSLFAFDKGESLSEHTAPFDAMVEIVDGSGDIIVNGVSNIVKEGEAIIMPAGIPHAVKAPQKFKMVLTMIKDAKKA